MKLLANALTGIVCVLHGYFFLLETFLWTTPYGLKTFNMTQEVAQSSQVLAANQGVYNALLAVGLLASFFIPNPTSASTLRTFCLLFIIGAGAYGGYSVNVKIFAIQAVPAILALAANWYTEA